jgi:hypothetical protein
MRTRSIDWSLVVSRAHEDAGFAGQFVVRSWLSSYVAERRSSRIVVSIVGC